MKKKLMIWNTAIVALALALMLGLGIFVTRSDRYEMTEEKIREITEIYAATFDPSDIRFSEDDAIRVTVLDNAGQVLADSDAVDPAEMENHSQREEILAAFAGTPKTVTNIVKTVKGFLPTTGDQQAAALLIALVIAMAGVGALVWGIRKR